MIASHPTPLGVAAGCTWLLVLALAAPTFAEQAPADEDARAADEPPGGDRAEPSAGEDAAKEEPRAEQEPDETEKEPPQRPAAKPAAGAKPAARAEANAASEPPAPVAEPEARATFETLDASAFPVYKTRGIPTGSLELDMHGLQWPYLPAVGGQPGVRVGFSGSVWVDNSYQSVQAGAEGDSDIRQWRQQGRLVLRFSPTYNFRHGWFIQAQGEPVLNSDQSQAQHMGTVVDTDDLYVRVGKWKLGDLQIGRFQGWEVYHLGLGLDLNTFERLGADSQNSHPVPLYGVTTAWDRPSAPGNIALHAYPLEVLRVELLGQLGSSSVSGNTLAARPVAILDFGFLKIKGSYEYRIDTPRQVGFLGEIETQGLGGQVQVILAPYLELGGGYAGMRIDQTDNNGDVSLEGSRDTSTYGGFLNVGILESLVIGGGVHYTDQSNLSPNTRTGRGEELTHLQTFGAIQYRLWRKLYFKAVFAYDEAEFDLNGPPQRFENTSLSGRVRAMYLF